MPNIAFIDTEIEVTTGKILDIGGIKNGGAQFHGASLSEFGKFLSGAEYVCGHNILKHDIKYVGQEVSGVGIPKENIIDTLYLSALLFPKKPYHKLVKDDKLQTEELNNPLNDSMKAMDLFNDELNAFNRLDEDLKEIFYSLLGKEEEFIGFFRACAYSHNKEESLLSKIRKTVLQGRSSSQLKSMINSRFEGYICEHAPVEKYISKSPVALAYALSLVNTYIPSDSLSLSPAWVLKNFPEVESIIRGLRNTPCLQGCTYCDKSTDVHAALKRFFGFDSFRTYEGENLQEQAVRAAVEGKSLLAVFPTGGGKSITFQLPALISGANMRALTVVISPLQSLMKDQVDNLEKKGITDAVTINGLLDPIERAKAFERVSDGSASILYISPESLRSKSVEKLILERTISRFVIDEAHCFSAWGQDFRVDYLYIGDFIKSVQEKKNLSDPIPVSCFTATAKLKVIEDIRSYFKEKLQTDFSLFTTSAQRTNLLYHVLRKDTDEEKYNTIRDLVEEKDCPTIIYVSRTKRAEDISLHLRQDGFGALPYHGRMTSETKQKNQDAFISGKVKIMVATSAFGMGVDKKDVGLVIHYDISDSLENYVQEAGRAGRDEHISAECYILYNDEDLSKHFILLNQTRLTIKEIQQVWRAVKELTKTRKKVSNSALDIARKAGWDEGVREIETRVTTAIAALENAGLLKREQNSPRVYATSIRARSAQEAIDKIDSSDKFDDKDKVSATRIIKKLISSRSKAQAIGEEGESRVDYLSDILGIDKADVIRVINLLREEDILSDEKDLTIYINRKGASSKRILSSFSRIEDFLLQNLKEEATTLNIKVLNEQAEQQGLKAVDAKRVKTIFNIWAVKKWLKYQITPGSPNHIRVMLRQPKELIREKMALRGELATFIVEYLLSKIDKDASQTEETAVTFSEVELKQGFERTIAGAEKKISLGDIEDALFYLSKIEAIKIEGGFLVIYNRLTLQRLTHNDTRYKKEDYKRLGDFYENKTQQIHIVGEYARKMLEEYNSALRFVDDYFHLNYYSFLGKYFNGRKEEIKRNITPAKFRQLFGELSLNQLNIIKDKTARHIVVAAGPGSGKTRLLVHKLAALLLMEEVKHEQLLMLTFSRAAATEFKLRLQGLIGNASSFVEIKTFHSYCFDILGQVGNVEKSGEIIRTAIDMILRDEVEPSRITKTVLVIDEAQDMDKDDFDLVKALMEKNEEMKVIAVGDDDQNIYGFRGSSSKYMQMLANEEGAVKYELVENYRSRANIVEFSDAFARTMQNRLKTHPAAARRKENGGLSIIRYSKDCSLTIPVCNEIQKRSLSGTSCVLTRTNEEALQISALLTERGVPARLIQKNDGFSLGNLAEARFFSDKINLWDTGSCTIDEDSWKEAERMLKENFRRSSNLEICLNLVEAFSLSNPKRKYKSDFRSFLEESSIEDFYKTDNETVTLSTMHKAKGKEFDNVFVVLDRFQINSDEDRRMLYVAMTRAKDNLCILENGDFFSSIRADDLECKTDKTNYGTPNKISLNLTHKDVRLSYFEFCKTAVSQLFAGDSLVPTEDGCKSSNGRPVLKFSKSFQSKKTDLEAKGYLLKDARVNFVLWWYDKENKRESLIVLPTMTFVKQ